MTGIVIARTARLDLRFARTPWRFADENRAKIDAHFAALKRERPAMWNGRSLLLTSHALDGDAFRGTYFETDFASLLAWRDWNFPDPGVKNSFAMGALRSADGAFLLGVMNAHTANAGKIYFPAGTPDPADISGDTVDLTGSVWREVEEETGLTRADCDPEPGWHSVFAGPRIAHMKVLQLRTDAAQARKQILDWLARQREPELADIRIVRSAADFDAAIQPFVTAFLTHVWGH